MRVQSFRCLIPARLQEHPQEEVRSAAQPGSVVVASICEHLGGDVHVALLKRMLDLCLLY